MPSFDIRYSIFIILYSLFNTKYKNIDLQHKAKVSFSIRPAVFLAGGGADKEDEECA
jgi:hypothetical protein